MLWGHGRKGAVIRGKQIFITGWCIRVSAGIRGQGWNIIRNNRDHITWRCMGTSVKSHKMLHRRGMVLKGRWRCGREVM